MINEKKLLELVKTMREVAKNDIYLSAEYENMEILSAELRGTAQGINSVLDLIDKFVLGGGSDE